MIGLFLHILRNICILLDFLLFFSFFLPPIFAAVGSAGCGYFSSWGGEGAVIAMRTGRGSGDCVAFIFLFVYAIPFVVLGPRCTWSWHCVHYSCRYLTGSVVPLDAVALTAVACQPLE